MSDQAMQTALALMAAELRGDHEGTAALVTGCDYLDEVMVVLATFAAEAARLAARREVPDEALAGLASRHLIRLAGAGRADPLTGGGHRFAGPSRLALPLGECLDGCAQP